MHNHNVDVTIDDLCMRASLVLIDLASNDSVIPENEIDTHVGLKIYGCFGAEFKQDSWTHWGSSERLRNGI